MSIFIQAGTATPKFTRNATVILDYLISEQTAESGKTAVEIAAGTGKSLVNVVAPVLDLLVDGQNTVRRSSDVTAQFWTFEFFNKVIYDTQFAPVASYTASTISFSASTDDISDSANGFVTAGFAVDDNLHITGSNNNNGVGDAGWDVNADTVAAGTISTNAALVDESAGATVTIESEPAAVKYARLNDNKTAAQVATALSIHEDIAESIMTIWSSSGRGTLIA